MATGSGTKVALTILAVIAVSFAAYQASGVFAPLVLALFIIAIVWPLQQRLQSRLPMLMALAITLIVIVAVGLAFASLVIWGFGRVGRAVMNDAGRYQALYGSLVTWLDGHCVSVAGLWAEHFNVGWLLRKAQRVTGRINSTLAFWLVTLTYVVLGLLEVDDIRRKIQALGNRDVARVLLQGSRDGGQVSKIHGGAHADARPDGPVRLAVRLGHRAAIRRRVGRDRFRAELYSVPRSVHRHAVPAAGG
jgi:AI-2 transport protein TqsA